MVVLAATSLLLTQSDGNAPFSMTIFQRFTVGR